MTIPEAYAQTLEEMSSFLVTDGSLEELLQQVLELTAAAVSGCAAVSVTVVDADGSYTTAAHSDEVASEIDQLQYDLGEGPCIDSLETGRHHHLEALSEERRWPRFADAVRDRGFGSVLSVPLNAAGRRVGALNIFAVEEHGLTEDDLRLATQIAGPAASTVANAAAYRHATRLAAQLQEALTSRAVIEQAKGILAYREGCTTEQAFELLRRASQETNRKLRDVARQVVDQALGQPSSAEA